jgi:hypothetical protein
MNRRLDLSTIPADQRAQAVADSMMAWAEAHWKDAAVRMRGHGVDEDVIAETCRFAMAQWVDAAMCMALNYPRITDDDFDFGEALEAMQRLDNGSVQ